MIWLLMSCEVLGGGTATPTAPTEPAAATPVSTTAADPALGAKVFSERCAMCHGPEGKGDGPAAVGLTTKPKDLSRPRTPEERKPPSRMEIIRVGVAGTAMPAFGPVLSPAELDAVSTYIHTLAHGPGGVPME